MRKIIVGAQVSMDGVMQAPGGRSIRYWRAGEPDAKLGGENRWGRRPARPRRTQSLLLIAPERDHHHVHVGRDRR